MRTQLCDALAPAKPHRLGLLFFIDQPRQQNDRAEAHLRVWNAHAAG